MLFGGSSVFLGSLCEANEAACVASHASECQILTGSDVPPGCRGGASRVQRWCLPGAEVCEAPSTNCCVVLQLLGERAALN